VGCGLSQIALYPGSFDPVTKGHEDIIFRASKLYSTLIVAVAHNPNKQIACLSSEERVSLLRESVANMNLPNVQIKQFSALTVQFAQEVGASVLIRGLRVISDFEYECSMYQANRALNNTIDTVFLMPALEYQFLSSRMVREVAAFGGSISAFVAPHVEKALTTKLAF
jgi:pantetheine-phosphate adenylyltransferase